VGTWTDIDDRRRAEDRHARDARLLANVRDCIIVTDATGIVTYWNDAATRTLGWTAAEMFGQPLLGRFPEEARPMVADLTRQIAEGLDWSGEFEDYHKDGSRVWIDARVARICNGAGHLIGIIGTSHDITARKRAEAERDRITARLRLQIDRTPLAYLMFDRDFRLVDWNAAAERTFGYTGEEVLGMMPPFEKILPRAAWPAGEDILSRLRAGDMAAHAINENVAKDGRTITCEWWNTPLLDPEGMFVGLISLAQDITERHRAEDALRASEERFRQIAESISEVFWLTTLDKGEIAYVSPGYETIWGRPREALYASPQSWMEAIAADDRERVARAAATQAAGTYDEEYRIVRPDGTIRWVRDRAFPVRDGNGRVVRVAGVAEDVTEKRRLEAQLRQAQKMEAIGQLAGGVAHDFNNLLTVINGCSELLLDAVGDRPDLREMLEEIRKAGERSASLTRQLLAFSRQQVLAPTILDVNEVVHDTEKMLRRLIGEDVVLTTVLQHPLGCVRVDRGQLEQVLLNLAVNARDAMPHGGELTIETHDIDLTDDFAAGRPGIAPGRHIALAVTDSGVGMSEHVRRRLFEPFFTTKEPGKGTGLGLAVVHGFAKQSGGCVEVRSEPGVGTCFTIYLPRIDARGGSSAGVVAERGLEHARGTGTILLIEDDDAVRALTKRVLQRCGYTVLDASRGADGLHLAATHRAPIDLLITDVVMPGISGRLVAEQIGASHPETKVLYVSGYTDDDVVRTGVLHDSVHFVQKPFSPAAIAHKVREILSS
jgi:PAS domain S-box-containing protein